jgi:K+-transporting ATPase KdpF subunit
MRVRRVQESRNDRPDLHRNYSRILFDRTRVRAGVREIEVKKTMNLESIVSLAISALLLFYLAYALLRPEKF